MNIFMAVIEGREFFRDVKFFLGMYGWLSRTRNLLLGGIIANFRVQLCILANFPGGGKTLSFPREIASISSIAYAEIESENRRF